MPDIFLSYSRQDLAVADRMAAALRAAGHDVWWDQALTSGQVYDKVTETALREARAVVVLWTAASVESDWVRSEATVALQRGTLMPVMIEACQRPVMFELRQSADLTGWKGNGKDPRLAAFVAEVTRQLGAAPTPAATPKLPPSPNRRLLIGGGVAAAALAGAGLVGWRQFGTTADDGTASVVVLPFANLSGDAGQAFFSDGIAEELRNALSQIRGLKVIGRVSSEQFRDTADLPAAAAKLGVDHVLTGSVRRSSTTIRIGAQLVDGRTGVESWSQSYDQPVGDALAIQSKIATSVVAALSAKLGKAAGQIIVGSTSNPQAQENFLKAQELHYRDRSEAGWLRADELLAAAVGLDPNYADAWAAIAVVKRSLLNFLTDAAEREKNLKAAAEAARRAVALAPNSGYALASLASTWLDLLDVRRAVADVQRAVALAPTDARVLNAAANIMRLVRPDQSIDLASRAVALDPFNAAFHEMLSNTLLAGRRPREAAAAARKAMALSDNRRGGNQLFAALFNQGQFDAAREAIQYTPFTDLRLTFLAMVEARAGNRAASDAALSQLRTLLNGRNAYRLAEAHAQRGETQAALAALEMALQQRMSLLLHVAIDGNLGNLDPIRNEPRFKAVQDAVIPPDLFVPPKRGRA